MEKFCSDDFSDLFNDSHMKIDEVEEDIQQFISFLDGSNNLEVRYTNICNVVYKFLHITSLVEMEEKLFRHLMPAVGNFLQTVFQEICNLLKGSEKECNVNTLKVLHDFLMMCVGLYEVLDCILNNLLHHDIINLCYIPSVPLEMVNILFLTFQHCKESEKVYHSYFSNLKEIVQLFKNAQDIHTKLLQLLTSRLTFDCEVPHEIELLKEVLLILGEIGEVLVDMNLKTLADNWKGYMQIIEKNVVALVQNSFSITKSLEFISYLINQNLENVLKINSSDQKSYNHVLKMCSFFIKILTKLCEMLWNSCADVHLPAVRFLILVYKFYPPYLNFKGYSENITSGIELLVVKSCDSLIDNCLFQSEFVLVLYELDVKEDLNLPGLLFFLTKVFSKVGCASNYRSEIRVDLLLDIIFKVIKESYVELFWSIQGQCRKQTFYEETCRNIANAILFVDTEQYCAIEVILIKNILVENIWNALAVLEIWELVLRCRGSEICCKTLVNIANITYPLLENAVTRRPAKVFIEHLLQRLYLSLSQIHRSQVIEKFPLNSHLQLWRCFTFMDFPINYSVFIESLVISTCEKIEDFRNNRSSPEDFYFICNSFDAIATLPASFNNDLKHLLTTVLKLWDFEVNLFALQNHTPLQFFMKKLFHITQHFVPNLNGSQLLALLLKVKDLSNVSFQIEILDMLRQVSHKSLNQFAEKSQIINVLTSMFSVLCTESYPITKQLYLETFVYFLNTTSHEEVLQNVIKNNPELQFDVTSFIQQNVTNQGGLQIFSANDYFEKQKSYMFIHKCPQFQRVEKVSADNDLNGIVKRIKTDLETLYKMSDKQFVENSFRDIVNTFN